MDDVDDVNRRWAEMLEAWAVPAELIAAAPRTPYFFDPGVFTAAADDALARLHDTVSDRIARSALPGDGAVLDVGVGAGAASLRLGARHITGVDSSRVLLAAFAERARELGVGHDTAEGVWPAVAEQVPAADVVVCHHVVYNVADLAPFVSELASHATRRVVIELTAVHPLAWMAPYWEALHGLTQPRTPTADDALAVVRSLGLAPHAQRWWRDLQMIGEQQDVQLARIARRLCLTEDRFPELRRLLADIPPPSAREVVTVWW